jgi:hypothetical protein
MTTPSAPPARPLAPAGRRPDWPAWLALLALAGYAVLLGLNTTIAAGGSDSSGYLNIVRMLQSGRLETPLRLPPGIQASDIVERFHFQPLGFHAYEDTPQPRMVPTYSSGLPLQIALASTVLGNAWGLRFVLLAHALAAVWLVHALGRELGLGRALAAAGAVVFGVCPLVLFAAIQPLSDLPAATWCLAAVWAGLRARRLPGWAAACGAAFGVAVLVRPTNALLLPALLVLVAWPWRRFLLFCAGGLPLAAWQAFYNHQLFGGVLSSGYINWQGFFAAEYLRPAALFFVRWLAFLLPAVLLVLPVAALGRRDTRTRELAVLALWFLGITSLYLFCAFSHEAWNSLRYLLPGVPPLILAGLLGLEALARARPPASANRLRTAAAVVIAGWAAGVSWHWTRAQGVFHIPRHEASYISSPAAARAEFPPGTLVLSCYTSGSLYYYTDFPILRYDAVTPAQFAQYAAKATRAGATVGALLFAEEEARALREHCPGHWQLRRTVDGVQVWRLAPP